MAAGISQSFGEGISEIDSQETLSAIASEVALLLNKRWTAKDMLSLLQVVFLDVEEAASLLRVEAKTIRSWVSQGNIPFRKARGKVLFLLPEVLAWTLPAGDRWERYRLPLASQCSITKPRLAAAPIQKGKGNK